MKLFIDPRVLRAVDWLIIALLFSLLANVVVASSAISQ